MVWTFHVRASTPHKPNQICQACLIEARLRGERGLKTISHLPCKFHGDPELWEENIEAWSVYDLVRMQVLLFDQADSRGKPKPPLIELNLAAVLPVLNLYIPKKRRRECLEKILLIHEVMQSKGVTDFFAKRGL